jgi:hypothetical protein
VGSCPYNSMQHQAVSPWGARCVVSALTSYNSLPATKFGCIRCRPPESVCWNKHVKEMVILVWLLKGTSVTNRMWLICHLMLTEDWSYCNVSIKVSEMEIVSPCASGILSSARKEISLFIMHCGVRNRFEFRQLRHWMQDRYYSSRRYKEIIN